ADTHRAPPRWSRLRHHNRYAHSPRAEALVEPEGSIVMQQLHDTREQWLMAAVDILRYPLGQVGAKVPDKVLVSVGFGPRNARKTLGFCFPTAMGSGIPHLFISPTLREPVAVLSTLTHELLHAADDCKSKHSGNF